MKRRLYLLIFTILIMASSLYAETKEMSFQIEKGEKWYHNLQILFFKKKLSPQIAVWSEDEKGNYIETIYVTEKTYKWYKSGGKKRKESLPVWRNRAECVTDDVAGATLNFESKKHRFKGEKSKITLYIEINNSFDYNYFYTKKNSNSSGQPSLIYSAQLENDKDSMAEFKLIGHGSSDGSDGTIYKDLSTITDARNILKKAEVVVK